LKSILHCGFGTGPREDGVLPLRYVRIVFSLAMLCLTLRGDGTITVRSQDVISGIDKAQQDREQKLSGYSATEHYTVRNSHFNLAAELTATVVYHKGRGKTYEILARSGPGLLQERVIGRILKEDAALSHDANRASNLLTSANYTMRVQGIPNTMLQGVPLVDLDVDQFLLPIATYARSYFLTARLAARRMVANGSGVIMTITAVPSRMGIPLVGGFAPAQAAVEALTRGLSAEFAPHGVRVVGCLGGF
jgi:NAD(P)-dependent dehydrogenase (short-subunit alcohol dehydrogenase family)